MRLKRTALKETLNLGRHSAFNLTRFPSNSVISMLMATLVTCSHVICQSDVSLETLNTKVQTYNVYKHSTFNLTRRLHYILFI